MSFSFGASQDNTGTYLEDVVTHLKYNDMFHAKVLLNEIHPLRAVAILVGVVVVAVELLHDVLLEVLEQVNFTLEILRELRHGVVLANVYRSLSPGRNVVKVAGKNTTSRLAPNMRMDTKLTPCQLTVRSSCCR